MDSCALYENCLCLLKAYGLKSLDELSSSEKDLRAKLRQFDILRDEKRIAALWNLIEDSGMVTKWFILFLLPLLLKIHSSITAWTDQSSPWPPEVTVTCRKMEAGANHVSDGTIDCSVAVDMDDDLLSQDNEDDTEESVKDEL